ncbi:hypothetical protein YERSI8AC_170077 [Enterobacterales bacterium 8AC]|nr:hypothetical protein YERSI8AC_170077 [Enterobacterales bacterium 8AC]
MTYFPLQYAKTKRLTLTLGRQNTDIQAKGYFNLALVQQQDGADGCSALKNHSR